MLLAWAQQATEGYEGVRVSNFTKSFWDGLAFCALVHHYHPRLIDFAALQAADKEHNLRLAFDTAEKLGVERLLDEEDMLAYPPERLSVITYLFELRKVPVR